MTAQCVTETLSVAATQASSFWLPAIIEKGEIVLHNWAVQKSYLYKTSPLWCFIPVRVSKEKRYSYDIRFYLFIGSII